MISQLEFEANAINLQVIRNNLRQIFSQQGVPKTTADEMVIALNEACMNIIQHAYFGASSGAGDGKILITVEKNNEKWRFELIDFAPAVDINTIKAKDLAEVRPGGLGLNFIQQIMDSVVFENLNED
ncbi:hypothetical protein MNBD_GAMMA23-2352, partial [hydrothermal vent metagenome]